MSTTKKVLQILAAMAFLVALFALAIGEVVPHPEDLQFKLSQTKDASTGSSWPSNPQASIGTLVPDGYNPGPSARSVSATMPDKAAYNGPQNVVDPDKVRQGGDDCASAEVITGLPYDDTGTTSGYTDDYEETGVFSCPYASTSPDVVYAFTPASDMQITIDLCASGYDTKVIVYENDCTADAYNCDDDGCGSSYRSIITGMAITAGNTYYIVVDGYGGASGSYTLHVEEYVVDECVVECPEGATMESEACGDDGNGGCNMATPTWEPLTCGETVCGTIWASGGTRDTDWYELYVSEPGPITWQVEAEFDVVIGFVAGCPDGSPDCGCITQLDPYTTGSCNDVISVTYDATAPGTYWLFVSHQAYDGLPCAINNDYVATVTCGGGGVGRCCYGDPTAPDCVDNIEYAECAGTYGGTFTAGLDCSTPCPVEEPCADCPPDGVAESEPCGSDYNGGCNMASPAWEPIECGETICGTVWADGGTRDTDWFELVLASDATITFECEAEFPFVVGYIAGCPMGSPDCSCITQLDPYAVGDPCTTQSITMALTAGTHWLFVSHQDYYDYPCGADNNYVATLTCGEPPIGRCCYGDPFNPSCDDVTPGECAGLGGSWDGTKNCTDDPCPIPQGNDECISAELMTSGMQVDGTTVGATIDCPGVLDWNAVWYYFEDPYSCSHATMDYCNVSSPINVECLGVVIYAQCDDCPNYILYTSNDWVECGTSSTQPITHFDYISGPATYYYPVFMGDPSCNNIESPFSFLFTLEECPPPQPGDNCDDPLYVTLPADLDYADNGQTTCGRINWVDNTCLGYYDGGEDIHYEITVTEPVDVDIKMDPLGTATWTGMLLDDACPADPTTCLYSTTTTGSSPLLLAGVHLEPGTYWVMIDTWPSPTCIPSFNFTITTAAPPTPGDDCDDPVEVKIPTDLPYEDLSDYTCTRGNLTAETCLGYYDGGEDIFYELQVTATTVVTITLDPKGTTYTGIAVDDVCPPDDACLAVVTGSSGSTLKVIEDLLLEPGLYYIMVDTWPSPACIPDFDLTIVQGANPGELTWTPSSFDFGTVNAGDNGSGTLTLDNIGQSDLNWAASVVYHGPSAPEIDGAYVAAMGDYAPGATMDVDFIAQNASSDAEWLDEITITFPAGVYVNSSTNFVSNVSPTRYLLWDGTTGDDQTTYWTNWDGGYGNIYSSEAGLATINITFDAGLSGPLTLAWTLSGDDYGDPPHDISGYLTINQADPAEAWLSVSPASGMIPGTGLAPQDVTVGWNAAGLYNETYDADIVISHDGVVANKGSATIPVTMTVTGGDLKILLAPEPMYIYYQFAYDPYMATMYIGNFNPPYTAADVATVELDGAPGTFVQTHPSMPGFSGDVAEFTFQVHDFLVACGAPMGSVIQPFAVTGTFTDATTFAGGGHCSLLGKNPATNGRTWLVPQDEVVLHGDISADGYIDIDDVMGVIALIFSGGPVPGPMAIADCDCQNGVDIDDVVYLIGYIFQNGPEPCH